MSSGDRIRTVLLSAVLFAGSILLFARTFNYGFVNYDDPTYVTKNLHVQEGLSWTGVRWAFAATVDFWQPLPWLSHQLDWSLFGAAAAGHHVTNVLWHAVNAVLVFLVFRQLLGGIWRAAFGAAWFAWHPLRVESVAWVTERKDVMSGCFFLLTLLAYAKYVRALGAKDDRVGSKRFANAAERTSQETPPCSPAPPADNSMSHRPAAVAGWAVLTVMAYLAGLMSKPMLVTLPIVLLVLDAWPFRRWTSLAALRPLIVEKLSLLALAAVAAIAAFLAERHSGAFVIAPSAASRAQNALVSLLRYVANALWPADLSVSYAYRMHWPPSVVIGAIVVAIAVGWFAWTQRRSRPWVAVGVAWYGITLLPVIGIVQIGFQSMADRYTYLPLLGLELALLGAVPLPRRRGVRMIVTTGAVAALGALTCRAWQQEAVWHDSVALFRHAVAVEPNSDVAEDLLASALVSTGNDDAAVGHAERAIVLNATNPTPRVTLAGIRARQGKLDAAAELYQSALALRPGDGLVACELGRIDYARGKTNEARELITSGLRTEPQLRARTLALARDALGRGNVPAARFLFEALVTVEPDGADAHAGIGMVDVAQGQFSAALDELRFAVSHNPSLAEAQLALAICADSLGRAEEAAKALEAAVAAAGNDPEVWAGAADVYAGRQDFTAAGRYYRRAVALAPGNARARVGLGLVLIATGDRAGGAEQWRQALQIAPDFPGLRERLEQLER